MNQELLKKAMAAKSPEELLQLAHENGMTDFTEENAKGYFEVMHKSGELADEELANAAGGCSKGGHLVVTRGNLCSHGWSEHINGVWVFTNWKCKTCQEVPSNYGHPGNGWVGAKKTCSCNRRNVDEFSAAFGVTADFEAVGACGSCYWCKYEDGVWYCNHPNY